MPSLPLATAFTDSATTEAGFKSAITDQREFLAGLLGTTGNQIDALKAMGVPLNDTVSKTGAYTVVAADRGVTLLCSGTFTVSLTAAATLGDGFTFAIVNTGTGVITIDPNSTEQIDGASTKEIAAGSWAIVNCTGSAFISMGAIPSNYVGEKVEIFTSSGSWTPPSGVTEASIFISGGGGGGRDGFSGYFGGRGGNAYVKLTGLSGTYTITIGSGGNGGGSPTSGGTTSFGTLVSATGGSAAPASSSNGSNGTATITTGTALRNYTGAVDNHWLATSGDISRPNGSGTTSALAYSTTGQCVAGARGSGSSLLNQSSGGIGGVIYIFY